MEYKSSRIAKYVLIGFAFVVVIGLVVMALWNWMVPNLLGGAEITFLQAIGVLILSRILFGSIGSGRKQNSKPWRKKFAKKVAAMSPEEREQFRKELGSYRQEDGAADESVEQKD